MLIAVKDYIKFFRRRVWESSIIEMVFVELWPVNSLTVIVSTFYKLQLNSFLGKALHNARPNLLILDEFNFPNIY